MMGRLVDFPIYIGETRPCMLLENFATLNVGRILLTESKNNK